MIVTDLDVGGGVAEVPITMDPRVTRLHCIMPIVNVPSVLDLGILSYDAAARLRHASVAMQPVQDRRDQKRVPQGLRLHQYANLYFHARNPMLYKRRAEASSLCILAVSLDALQIPNTVITDSNAASDYARFLHPDQWGLINFDDVLAESWNHPDDPRRHFQHKSRKCAEVLVPRRVPPEMVIGAYVVDAPARAGLRGVAPHLPSATDPVLFFHANPW